MRLEEDKIVWVKETSTLESVPQSNCSEEKCLSETFILSMEWR